VSGSSPLAGKSLAAFAFLGLAAVAAFWPSYLTRLTDVGAPVHAHAAAMTAWIVLLVAQAWLMRSGRRAAHRALGRVSYVLVPFAVLATLALARHMLRHAKTPLVDETLYFLYLQLSLIAVFALCWVQAIRHRRTPHLHAAWMIGTGLALVDPIGARILFHAFGAQPPLMQLVTFALVDALLVALLLRERRRAPPVRAYPALLAIFVATQLPTFFVHKTAAWRAFAEALAAR
jgi:hypothetical protein